MRVTASWVELEKWDRELVRHLVNLGAPDVVVKDVCGNVSKLMEWHEAHPDAALADSVRMPPTQTVAQECPVCWLVWLGRAAQLVRAVARTRGVGVKAAYERTLARHHSWIARKLAGAQMGSSWTGDVMAWPEVGRCAAVVEEICRHIVTIHYRAGSSESFFYVR